MDIFNYLKSDLYLKKSSIHLVNYKMGKSFFLIFISILFFTACSNSEALNRSLWSFLPDSIDSFKSFLRACVIFTLIIKIIEHFIRVFTGLRLGFIISLILFIVVLITTGYGFFLTLLLFAVSYLIIFLIAIIFRF